MAKWSGFEWSKKGAKEEVEYDELWMVVYMDMFRYG